MTTEFSQSDVKIVLKTFAEKCSTTFSSFLEVWRSLKCFRLLEVFNEKREDSTPDQFTYRLNTEILNGLIPAIVEHLGEEHSEYYRIGAVYFVYAVYMNQPPSVETVKINLTVDLYRSVIKLHQDLKKDKHCEVDYALTTLFCKGAFALSMDVRRRSLRVSNIHMHQRALTEFVHEDHNVFLAAVSQFKTKQLQNIAATYHRSKESLSLPGCVMRPSRLHSQLAGLLPEYCKWQDDRSQFGRHLYVCASEEQPQEFKITETRSTAVHGSSVQTSDEQQLHLKRRSLINQAFEAEASTSRSKGKRRKVEAATPSRPKQSRGSTSKKI